eukprot:g6806.t1
MRLTADVIVHARASINPCDERELDLRGYKIPMIENLGVTQDQFDAMDFSDNEIKKLDNFPRYKRLSSLLFCNNHISKISEDLGTTLPNLSCLILTNNKLSTLAELKGLATCTKLTMLSLLHNEVVSKQYYRLYMINLVPSLKQLDFQKVTVKERESAARLARSQAGQAMMQDVAQQAEKAKTFTPGAPAAEEQKLTDEHRAIYADRIAKATTVEEIEMLSKKIQAGIIPSANYKQGGGGGGGGVPAANGAAAAAPAATAASPAKSPAAKPLNPAASGDAAPAPAPAAEPPAAASSMDVDGEGEEPVAAAAAAVAGSGGAPQEEAGAAAAAAAAAAAPGADAGTGGKEDKADGEPSSADGADGGGGGDGDAMVDEEEEVGGEGAPPQAKEKEGEAELEAVQEVAAEDMEQESGEGDGGEPKLSQAEIKGYKVAQLKQALVERGLPTNGLKADLASRLLEANGY